VLVGIAAWGVVLSAVAMLRAVRAIAFGPMSQAVEAEGVSDLQGAREAWPFAVLTLALLLVGIIPLVVYGPAQPVLERLLVP
jgi:NADH:ubiquinone oxidoreductase subunit 4 (subunit M)